MNFDEMTEAELEKLAKNGTHQEKRAVARHPSTQLQTLLFLAKCDFAEEVDQNPLMQLYIEVGSVEVVRILSEVAKQTKRRQRLEELASSTCEDVRQNVAGNAWTSSATLARLATEESDSVRGEVADNESTPSTVARNENTSQCVLEQLSKDEVPSVRINVASNKNVPQHILEILACDSEASVKNFAQSIKDRKNT